LRGTQREIAFGNHAVYLANQIVLLRQLIGLD